MTLHLQDLEQQARLCHYWNRYVLYL